MNTKFLAKCSRKLKTSLTVVRDEVVAICAERRRDYDVSDGKTKSVIDHDNEGEKVQAPNDIALDGKGGAYVMLSGPWATPPIVGKVVHVTLDGRAKVLAKDIQYVNGIQVSKTGGTTWRYQAHHRSRDAGPPGWHLEHLRADLS